MMIYHSERKTNANKRNSSCRYLCSLKHLKPIHTFAQADFVQQFNPALSKASAVKLSKN